MAVRLAELCSKELIDVSDGTRYGYVGDVELDAESGRVSALVVCGRRRLFGLLGWEEERVFPWSSVRRLGEDIILVDGGGRVGRPERVRSPDRWERTVK